MSDPVLFLSRPATDGLNLIHERVNLKRIEPVWRLLVTAVLAAGAALTFATVVIFGAPGGEANTGKGDPLHIMIAAGPR
jgi:hypothetical protein